MQLPKYAVTLISVLLFVLLFFEKSLGLNVLLYAIATSLLIIVFKKQFIQSHINKVVIAGFVLTTLFYYLYASPFALAIAFLSLILLFGLHTQPSISNLAYSLPNFIPNYFNAIGSFIMSFSSRKKGVRTNRLG